MNINTTQKAGGIMARLRVRRVDETAVVHATMARAVESGRAAVSVVHGGSVANSYGYRAQTEVCVCVAFPDGRVSMTLDRLPANKVTRHGCFANHCLNVGFRGDVCAYDERCTDKRRADSMAAFIAFSDTIAK